ncbi:MAG: oligosaccharide flippase family protein [Paracoccaceae bacterium]
MASLLLLLRSVAIARLISVTDFGIASTFALSLFIIEMLSALGIQQQIVQHKDGNEEFFQNTLHGLQGVRAIVNAVLLFCLAGPIAGFFNVPDAAWAYRVMALVPLMTGFAHLDPHRMNRKMQYLPTLTTAVVSALMSLLLIWPLSRFFTDYSLMLYAVLIQSLTALLISHLLAERRYGWHFDRSVIRDSLRFGWPVILNAILLFLVFNGERLIVGRELGMGDLAVFSMAFTLVLAPTLVMEGSAQSFFLPQLSAARADKDKFEHLSMATLQCHLFFGALILTGVALLGGPVVHLLLGPKYAAAIPILTWLAIMQGVRVSKGGSSAITLAHAFTENGLVASLMRVALLPLAWYITATGGSLLHVIWLGTVGELIGFVASLLLARYRLRLSLRPLLPQLGVMVAMYLVGALHAYGQSSPDHPHLSPLWTGGALIVLFGLAIVTGKDLKLYVRRRVMKVQD